MSQDVQTYDLIIVGAGSGNMIPVPEMDNWRLAIVEPDKFGGTCLNRGCIPSKMLLYPAEVVETTRHAARLGVHHTLDRVDWDHIVNRVWQKIDPIAEAGSAYRQSQPHITVYDQPARFVEPRVLQTGSHRITADRIVLGAGARPVVPELPGLDTVPYHTSDTVMRLDTQPESILIIGGGYIGIELGSVWRRLGAKVTVMDITEGQLAGDRQAAAHYGYEARIEQGDMRDLSRFDDDAFDFVWQPYSINFVPDYAPIFRGVARVLRPGGVVVEGTAGNTGIGLALVAFAAVWGGIFIFLERAPGSLASYGDEESGASRGRTSRQYRADPFLLPNRCRRSRLTPGSPRRGSPSAC